MNNEENGYLDKETFDNFITNHHHTLVTKVDANTKDLGAVKNTVAFIKGELIVLIPLVLAVAGMVVYLVSSVGS